MSENDKSFGFGAFVPGFDFLQGLVKSAAQGAAGGAPQGAPDWSKWVAPTLQADEIEKRIGELKTVQFWLEQNARALAATIQALEVQKMTLATLRDMNVQVKDMAQAFGFGKTAASADSPAWQKPAPASGAYDDMYTHRPEEAGKGPATPTPTQTPPDTSATSAASAARATGAPAVVDPLQWWGALAGQFQQIAAGAMQEAAEQARQSPAVDLQDAARKAFEAAGRMGADVAAAAAVVRPVPATPARKASATRKTAPVKTAKPAAVAKKAARKASAPRKATTKSAAQRRTR